MISAINIDIISFLYYEEELYIVIQEGTGAGFVCKRQVCCKLAGAKRLGSPSAAQGKVKVKSHVTRYIFTVVARRLTGRTSVAAK